MPKQKIKGHTLCILHGTTHSTIRPLIPFRPYKLLIDPRRLLYLGNKRRRKPKAACESAAKAVLFSPKIVE